MKIIRNWLSNCNEIKLYNFISATFIVPVGAPGKVLDGTVSDTEITVSWEPVPADETNGQLLGYKV